MATTYVYASARHSTLADAQASVPAFKEILDTRPTNWVVVKQVNRSTDGDGWVIPPTTLMDANILSLHPTEHYSVFSLFSGENFLGLTGTEAMEKIYSFRALYAGRMHAGVILEIDGDSIREVPTNIDMSGYM